MAITITPALAGSVGNRIAYLVTVAVSAGTTGAQTATIANATLLADAVEDSPVAGFFGGSYADVTEARTAVFSKHTWNVSDVSGGALSGQFAFTASPNAAATLFTVTLDYRLAAAADGTYLFLLEFIFNEVGYSFPHGGPG